MDTSPYALEWLKVKRLTISSVTKDVEQLQYSYITGRRQNGKATLENRLTVSKNVEHTLNIKAQR